MDDAYTVRARIQTLADEQAWERLRNAIAVLIASDPDYRRIVGDLLHPTD